MDRKTNLRVARPTNNFEEVMRFYIAGLGLEELGSFEAGRAPTKDNLLVFYLPAEQEWQAAVDRMVKAGYLPVPSFNPYWDRNGRTFEDPDGYRVVLQRGTWSN